MLETYNRDGNRKQHSEETEWNKRTNGRWNESEHMMVLKTERTLSIAVVLEGNLRAALVRHVHLVDSSLSYGSCSQTYISAHKVLVAIFWNEVVWRMQVKFIWCPFILPKTRAQCSDIKVNFKILQSIRGLRTALPFGHVSYYMVQAQLLAFQEINNRLSIVLGKFDTRWRMMLQFFWTQVHDEKWGPVFVEGNET